MHELHRGSLVAPSLNEQVKDLAFIVRPDLKVAAPIGVQNPRRFTHSR
jgi:hypothetical protein